ncbi:hypothetical protein O181_004977 [Austropuccinia psidii MF-1]|uniref:Integrase catalytic domain-containing protein n=1 Tax=Austropuccinia psidii MF-1 TaxID=1389203 RepID=A0A9Q3BHA8_9BASI|nr:hypothetical protein [Austropuccinia psidii MF-1]
MWRLNAAKGLPIDPLPLADCSCESCSFVKSTHKPFACKSWNLVKALRDVIVVDLVGPFPPLVQKHLYGLVIQDHFSSLMACIPLQAKSEAVREILGWLKTFNILSGHQVKRLRSDNAGEFISNAFRDSLQQLGITHETTIPYEHHQNGKVERVICTLSEAARAIMLEKHVDVALWLWAFWNAAWVFNRILHAMGNGYWDQTKYIYSACFWLCGLCSLSFAQKRFKGQVVEADTSWCCTGCQGSLMDKLQKELLASVQLKWDSTIHSIVGIEVQQTGHEFRLSQQALIAKLVADHTNNFSPCQPLPNMMLKSEAARRVDREYLSEIGMILCVNHEMNTFLGGVCCTAAVISKTSKSIGLIEIKYLSYHEKKSGHFKNDPVPLP